MKSNLKEHVIFVVLSIVLFLVNYLTFDFFIQEAISFSLLAVCLFHLIASVLVYTLVQLALSFVPSQGGVAFLALVFIKLGVFTMIFSSSILGEESMSKLEKLILVIPMFSFVLLEGISLARSLKLLDLKLNEQANSDKKE